MSNPNHTPRQEALLIEVEAIKRAYDSVKRKHNHFTDDLTPAYRRDVCNVLADRYNKRCDDLRLDFIPLRQVRLLDDGQLDDVRA